jgi:hypothetical protein
MSKRKINLLEIELKQTGTGRVKGGEEEGER